MHLSSIFSKVVSDDGDSSPHYYAVVCGDDSDLTPHLNHVYVTSPRSSSSSEQGDVSPERSNPHLDPWSVNVIHKYTTGFGSYPSLEMVEEPVEMFRFRYKSEMSGTHGSLIGRNSSQSRGKTYPTVRLKNYSGEAKIMCTLVQNKDCEVPRVHPHQLVIRQHDEESMEPQNIYVNSKNGYTAKFSGMAIVHTAKKKVHLELFKKRKELLECQNRQLTVDDENRLKSQCESESRNINMNSVRLCFTAFDIKNNQLCNPLLSAAIDNLKSAETGQLKITRMSKSHGSVKGGDEIYMFVEKVSKKNIKVRFFEMEGNERLWSADAVFSETDVHHQFGIVFTTPPYKNIETKYKVDVYVELYRPKDGAISNPKPFQYKPAAINHKRRRAAENSLSSLMSSKSWSSDVPLTVAGFAEEAKCPKMILGDALFQTHGGDLTMFTKTDDCMMTVNNSSLDKISREQLVMESPFLSSDMQAYEISYEGDMLEMMGSQTLLLDGKKPTISTVKKESVSPDDGEEGEFLYNGADLDNASKAIKLLHILMKSKVNLESTEKLLTLFDIKLKDGDSFLHMFIAMNHIKMLKILLELIKRLEMQTLLDYANDRGETALHTAVLFFRHEMMGLLLSSGCDPNLHDMEDGNTPLHLTVKEDNSECMVQLLDQNNYNTKYSKKLDVNIINNAGWTALHLAAMCSSLASVSRLMNAGADCNVAGRSNGQTILHIAVANAHIVLINYILEHSKINIDSKTGTGHTALHMCCESNNPRAHEICELLLKKDANLKIKYNSISVLDLAKSNGNVKVFNLIKQYKNGSVDNKNVDHKIVEDSAMSVDGAVEIKEEPIDFGDGTFLDSKTISIVTSLLNESGMWKILAVELGQTSLISLCQESDNPSRMLLHYIELEEKVSLRQLYDLLLKLGEIDAAKAVQNILRD